MSYLNVTNVSHTFGGRQILENVSFKLLRGEHVGLVGANGEGKSTFLNIVTGHLLPDEGKVEWPGRVTVGYLDQQSTLEAGKTIREVLRTAFNDMYEAEKQMLELYDKMAEAAPEEIDKMMNTVGEIQTELEHSGFYSLDTKIEEVANGLGLGSIGLDRDVSELSGDWRLHQKLFQVLTKYMDCTVFCLIREVAADFSFDCRSDKTLVAILYYSFQDWCCIWVVFYNDSLVQVTENIFFRSIYLYSDKFLLFSAV